MKWKCAFMAGSCAFIAGRMSGHGREDLGGGVMRAAMEGKASGDGRTAPFLCRKVSFLRREIPFLCPEDSFLRRKGSRRGAETGPALVGRGNVRSCGANA